MSEDQDIQPTEREELEARANTLGITFHPNIGDEKLREKVNEAIQAKPAAPVPPVTPAPAEAPVAVVKRSLDDSVHSNKNAPAVESRNAFATRKQREAGELVRVHITNMNPATKDYEGDIFCAGNTIVGTFKKYVPFNQDYHVPRIILKTLQEKKCQIFYEVKDEKGRKVKRGKLIKEFAIDVLDPLTAAELKALGQRQAMAAGTSE